MRYCENCRIEFEGELCPRCGSSGEAVLSKSLTLTEEELLSALAPFEYERVGDGIRIIGVKDEDITEAAIPDGVTEIGDFALEGLEKLTRVYLPDSLLRIGEHAFDLCKSLGQVNIPGDLKYIGAFAFCATDIEEVVIPYGVTVINEHSFYGCARLTKLYIPSSVTSIEESAFGDCTSLAEVTLPRSVTALDAAFSGCTSLTDILLEEGSEFLKLDGAIYTKDMTTLLCYPAGRAAETLRIPDSVVRLGQYAFAGCELVAEIVLPEGVTELPESAFWGCKGLKRINLPKGLKRVGDRAFTYCESLTELSLPRSVEYIGESAFSDCMALGDLSLPEGLTEIGSYAFADCRAFTRVEIPDSVRTIGDGAWQCAYFGDTPHSHITELVIGNGVTALPACAFYGCGRITHLTLSDTLVKVGKDAFAKCVGVRQVTFHGNKRAWRELLPKLCLPEKIKVKLK